MNKEELTLKIETLKSYTMGLNERIEIKAIWLFVATLSCWSVNVSELQIFAMFLVLILYIKQVKRKTDMSFADKKVEVIDIENAIEKIEPGDEKKARLYDLGVIKKELKNSIINLPIFHLCYAFWGLSIFVFLFRLGNDYFP